MLTTIRCPKCNYPLTYLERRYKFKCSKCSSLFSEKQIALKEHWKILNKERAIIYKELEEIKKQAARDTKRKYEQDHKEQRKKYSKKYYEKNRDKIMAQQKEWKKNLSDEHKDKRRARINLRVREYREKQKRENIDAVRLDRRIRHFKWRQNLLARENWEFLLFRLLGRQI